MRHSDGARHGMRRALWFGMKTMHLQSIGSVPAVALKDCKPGDRLMWNFGEVSIIVAMVPSESGKSYMVTERCKTGDFTRRLGADRLVSRVTE